MADVRDAANGVGQGGVAQPSRFDPFVPGFSENPYPIYARYREADPVHYGAPPTPNVDGCWYLFRFDHVMAGLKDARFIRPQMASSQAVPEAYRPFVEMSRNWMLFRNPPDHTRLRSLVNRAFTPKMVSALEPRIREIAAQLVDAAEDDGGMDLIGDYAFPLPVIVIAEMLGIPSEDRDLFKEWSRVGTAAIDVRTSPDVYAAASQATLEMSDYLGRIIRHRRSEPRNDLISGLIAAEEEGSRLNEEELVAMCILLLIAGHETTINLIGNGMLALLSSPAEMEKLRERPGLIDNAIEELLRYDSPVQVTFRVAAEEVEMGGRAIAPGSGVGFIFGAANRDPERFADPDRLDVERKVGRHSAFGMGIHFCLGAPLARLEGQIAVNTLLDRLPTLALTGEPLQWREGMSFHGLQALPVRF
ncbi:MAG: cytochrome P450 [Trueperaceae bacterium]